MILALTAVEGRPRSGRPRLVSVVVPLLDEELTLPEFYGRVKAALGAFEWELIGVDDGSVDRTPEILRSLAAEDERVRMVRLSRRFGHQAALTAGLDAAAGDVVITIDGDLQDPPELIPGLVAEWASGADVVHAVRKRRAGEPRWRLAAIHGFYRLYSRLAGIDVVSNSGDYRLLSRQAVSALRSTQERNRFLRGLSVWIGFEQTQVLYDRDARYAGETKYPLGRLFELALDGLISFSRTPLRIAAIFGGLASAAALIAIPVVIIKKIAGSYVPGIASLTVVVLLLGGIQLLTLGVIGEYLGRSYEEAKRRPIYLVRELCNAPDDRGPAELGDDEAVLERTS
jgi:dolichol-phosphate mannosyltransferase